MAQRVTRHSQARPTERRTAVDERSVNERVISGAGDPFLYAAPSLAEMLPSQRDKLLREHYAPEYR
jgi:hypothetical protein